MSTVAHRPEGHVVCTIASPSYAAKVAVLAQSLARVCGEKDFRFLVLQDCGNVSEMQDYLDHALGNVPHTGSFRANSLDEVGWGDFDVVTAMVQYDVLEFATSVKPALLRSLLAEGYERVTYLDPDIEVHHDFSLLLDDAADVSLTPHLLSEAPDDGQSPNSYDILIAGKYNLGFISVRPGADDFLKWWGGHLQFNCRDEVATGRFTDQRIMDLAPLKAKVQELENPGLNVAYWNLHERQVAASSSGWQVHFRESSVPLYFFHFSGFRTSSASSLSVHATRPILGTRVPWDFVRRYEGALDTALKASLPQDALLGVQGSGEIPDFWRRCIRQEMELHVRAGWSLSQVRDALIEQATVDVPACMTCGIAHEGVGAAARQVLTAWACRPSLEGVPNGIACRFWNQDFTYNATPLEQMEWGLQQSPESLDGPLWLRENLSDAIRRANENVSSLLLVGYFSYPAGMGQLARSLLEIIEAAGIEVSLHRRCGPIDSIEYLSHLLFRWNRAPASTVAVFAIVNADMWRHEITESHLVDCSTQNVAALWAWELEELSSEMVEVYQEEGPFALHALSSWGADAMTVQLGDHVGQLTPFPFSRLLALSSQSHAPKRDDLPDHYVLAAFDAKSIIDRKNPQGVLDVWQRVEREFPDVWLVVKTSDFLSHASTTLYEMLERSPRTLLIDEVLNETDHVELIKNCTAFVSLHRSEGLGLGPIEAALAHRPVIYTNYGGLVEFFAGTFFPVEYSMSTVSAARHDTGPYPKTAYWAEPDLDSAERQLRTVLQQTLFSDRLFSSQIQRDAAELRQRLLDAQENLLGTVRSLLPNDPSPYCVPICLPEGENNLEGRDVSPRFISASVACARWMYSKLPKNLRDKITATRAQQATQSQ